MPSIINPQNSSLFKFRGGAAAAATFQGTAPPSVSFKNSLVQKIGPIDEIRESDIKDGEGSTTKKNSVANKTGRAPMFEVIENGMGVQTSSSEEESSLMSWNYVP
jgi:hypothetical protein